MNFKTYFIKKFPNHLRRLNYKQPNAIVRNRIMNDPNVLFFGGRNWENFTSDLENIPEQDQERFILTLFMIVVSDQNLYRYFNDKYPRWRARTMFPKFGWSGFGSHIENPMKILNVPETKGYLKIESINKLVPLFVEFYWDEVEGIIERYQLNIDRTVFFESMVNDPEFANDSGEFASSIRKKILEKL